MKRKEKRNTDSGASKNNGENRKSNMNDGENKNEDVEMMQSFKRQQRNLALKKKEEYKIEDESIN